MEENKAEADSSLETVNKIECAVCLQPCVQPVMLPCRHVFCFLCVKGVTHQSKRCAMCRQEIPSNYLDNPQLIENTPSKVAFEGSYQWFYEGRNGWWQYDDRTSFEIEAAYKEGEEQCEVLIAGFLYVIDFPKELQFRRCDPSRKRRIKRDLVSIPKKGVAGVRDNLDAASVDSLNLAGMTLSDQPDENATCSVECRGNLAHLPDEKSSTNNIQDIPSGS
uniref:E3 ubiquitin-protein ligase n=1 Tax=Parasteatoda tepidariorum TaxID=114398 RepID=A0A2L2YD22_PARTP